MPPTGRAALRRATRPATTCSCRAVHAVKSPCACWSGCRPRTTCWSSSTGWGAACSLRLGSAASWRLAVSTGGEPWPLSPLASVRVSASEDAGRAGGRCRPLSGIEPSLAPGPACIAAPEQDPLVQTEGPVVPELHFARDDAETRPVGRPGDIAERISGRHDGDGLLERKAALQGARLLRGPRAEPTAARA